MPIYQAFRARALSPGASGYFSISEMQLRATAGGPDLVGAGTPIASGSYPGLPITAAFDGNYSTNWASGGGGIGDWGGYDFGVPTLVEEIVISARNDSSWNQIPADMAIDGYDGSIWTEIIQYLGIPWVQSNSTLATAQFFSIIPPVGDNVSIVRSYEIDGPSAQLFVPAVRHYEIDGPSAQLFVPAVRHYVIEGPPGFFRRRHMSVL